MPTTQDIDRVARAAGLSLCLVLTLGAAPALAHGTSGGIHAGASIHAPPASPVAPMASPGLAAHTPSGTHAATPGAQSTGSTSAALSQPSAPSTLPSSVVQGCEGAVEANCLAKAESALGASGGDTTPLWSAPVPTTLPAAATSNPITEPAPDTSLPLEQSGGASGVITAGGGPTLTDCMALWDPAVHMTKSLWKSVCIRTMNGIEEPSLAIHSVDPATPAHASARTTTRPKSASHG